MTIIVWYFICGVADCIFSNITIPVAIIFHGGVHNYIDAQCLPQI